jgi:hypothetical protein
MEPRALICSSSEGVVWRHAKSAATDRYLLVWDGFLFQNDGHAEHRAVRSVLESLEGGQPPEVLIRRLRGSFFLVLWDRCAGVSTAAVDNSGLYSAYRGSRFVANSFLHLLKTEDIGLDDLCAEAVVEFLQLGNVYSGRTLTPHIRRLDADELVRTDGDRLVSEGKGGPQLTDPPAHADLFQASEPLASAMRGRQLSIDLTGGFDSRLLACLLCHHGVNFETALSGRETHVDRQLARPVAAALDRPFYFTEYHGEHILENLEDTLIRLDGLGATICTCDRILALNDDRRRRGIDIIFRASGGELYKDFFWLQDFPFYWRKTSNLARLHRLRIEFEQLPGRAFTPTYADAYQAARSNRITRLERYRLARNTQTYDNVYFRERVQTWNSREITSCQVAGMPSHAPLSESELVRIGYGASRSMRYYNRLHRHYIGAASPRAARMPTTDGTSASPHWCHMLVDGAGYSRSKLRKLVNKLSERMFNKTIVKSCSADLNAEARLRLVNSQVASQSLRALQEAGILREGISYEDLPPRFHEHVLALGWLVCRLEASS